ncbi:MAG: hypothetical protein FWF02_07335 [Micrococcales bacterium]|nr:hypothetical protein [Micrococcales bacterium]MCL2667504.1 hypothetical protein [Micrococcales bacterium]
MTAGADTAPRVATPRNLTPGEQARLEAAVDRVLRLVDPLDPLRVAELWDRLLEGGQYDDLEGARSVGVAIGTLLLDADPTARWVSCLGPRGWTPGVVSEARPFSPVLPVADSLSRWPGAPADWIEPYINGSLDHLLNPGGLDDHPWIPSTDDLPQPPASQVADLATTALNLGLALAGDESRAFAVLPGAGGPMSAPAPGDPTDRDAVRTWARAWGVQAGAPMLAVAWVEPPRGSARHALVRAGSVVVEASEAGRPGVVMAHEFTTGRGGTAGSGGPVIIGASNPVL